MFIVHLIDRNVEVLSECFCLFGGESHSEAEDRRIPLGRGMGEVWLVLRDVFPADFWSLYVPRQALLRIKHEVDAYLHLSSCMK